MDKNSEFEGMRSIAERLGLYEALGKPLPADLRSDPDWIRVMTSADTSRYQRDGQKLGYRHVDSEESAK